MGLGEGGLPQAEPRHAARPDSWRRRDRADRPQGPQPIAALAPGAACRRGHLLRRGRGGKVPRGVQGVERGVLLRRHPAQAHVLLHQDGRVGQDPRGEGEGQDLGQGELGVLLLQVGAGAGGQLQEAARCAADAALAGCGGGVLHLGRDRAHARAGLALRGPADRPQKVPRGRDAVAAGGLVPRAPRGDGRQALLVRDPAPAGLRGLRQGQRRLHLRGIAPLQARRRLMPQALSWLEGLSPLSAA
mmetsp:Transcript_35195/g.60273  ORF Transcript_35195/g.60273 Transcript_35195/m.60273 type:complete len:245 (+) Transcript_35195:250-984(+)